MNIRFTQACTVRTTFKPGDEIRMTSLTPELEQLLKSQRIDGKSVCEIVRGGKASDRVADEDEAAIVRR